MNHSGINIKEIKHDVLGSRAQVIILNEDGRAIDSDNTILTINLKKFNLYKEPVFCGLKEVFETLTKNETFKLPDIETNFNGRYSHYDFEVKRIYVSSDHFHIALVILDFGHHYEALQELRQERNDSEIYAFELAEMHKKLRNALIETQENKKQLEATQSQLIQNEKMASIGHLTAGLGHEINNPLNFIYNGAKSLLSKINAIESFTYNTNPKLINELIHDSIQLVEIIQTGTDRIKKVVRELQLFGNADKQRLKLTDVHDCLDTCISLLKYQIKDNIKIEKKYDAKIGKTHCLRGKLNQVFMNLLQNAVQSIEPGKRGTIEISTRIDNNYIFISIQDNGVGISKEIQRNVFDPFFTTKETGQATGLGLPISYSIMKEHGGNLSFVSEKNMGTKFLIELPIT